MVVVTHAMCLNKEVVHQVSHTQIAFQCCCQVKSSYNVRVRGRNAYQHFSGFDRVQIVAYQDCDLSCYSNVAYID